MVSQQHLCCTMVELSGESLRLCQQEGVLPNSMAQQSSRQPQVCDLNFLMSTGKVHSIWLWLPYDGRASQAYTTDHITSHQLETKAVAATGIHLGRVLEAATRDPHMGASRRQRAASSKHPRMESLLLR